MRWLGLLRGNPALARLLAAETISPLGDAMSTVALILHVQAVEGTGTAVAVALLSGSLPPVLSPVLGAIADRADKKKLLIAASLGQAGAVAAVAIWLPPLARLFLLFLARGVFAAAFYPAARAAVPGVVDDDELPSSNALLAGARELGSVVGPPAAGLLFTFVGARGVFAVDVATFLIAAALLLALPSLPAHHDDAEVKSLASDTRAGLVALWRHPVARGVAVGFWLLVLTSGADDLVLPFLGRDTFGASPFAIGVLLAGASVGLVVGLALVVKRLRPSSALMAIVLGAVIASGGNFLTGLAPMLAIAFGAQVVRGLGIAYLDVSVQTLLQREVPRAMLGRVMANVYGGVYVAGALSYAIAGPLLDATSPRFMFWLIGGGGLLASFMFFTLVRPRASLDGGSY